MEDIQLKIPFEGEENIGSPLASPTARRNPSRKSLGELDAKVLNVQDKVAESPKKGMITQKSAKKAPRSIKKMLSTPVKALRNLLPSVPSGWYGSEKGEESASKVKKTSVSERIKELNGEGVTSPVMEENDHMDLVLPQPPTSKTSRDDKVKEKSSRRISMGLTMKGLYDEETHLPKYSQAELDAAVKKAVNKAGAGNQKTSTDVATSKKVAMLEQDVAQLTEALSTAQNECKTARSAQMTASKEAADAKAQLDSFGEDVGLQKVQSKALTHRLQSLEREHAELQTKFDECRASADDAQKVAVAAATAEAAAALSARDEAHAAALQAATEDANKRVAELQAALAAAAHDAKAREASIAARITAEVKAAKARVYEKAQAQFEAGNKEFKTMRAQYKQASAEKEALSRELQAVNDATAAVNEEKEKLMVKVAAGDGFIQALLEAVDVPYSASNVAESVEAAMGKVRTTGSSLSLAEKEVELLKLKVPELKTHVEKAEAANTMLESKLALGQETLRATEALLEESKKEMKAMGVERDAQMMAVAKLSTKNAQLEQQVEEVSKERDELQSRTANLRKMNEEMLTMLEANQS